MASSVPTVGDSTTWHLCWQAAVGCDLFADPQLCARLRDRLICAHRRRGRELVDYLLMPREFHVISRVTTGDSPGGVARAIGSVVARWVREIQPIRSPVFAGPFRAVPLATDGELRDAIRLLAWRPVSEGRCRTPIHHPQSALRATLGLRPAQGFDARPLLRLFGETVPEAREALSRWLARRPADREMRQWQLLCGLALAIGMTGPRALACREIRCATTACLVAAGGADGVDGALRLLEVWVNAKLGANRSRTARDARYVHARARGLVACLAVDHGLCSAASVARHFGKAKATLSEQMSACRKRTTDKPLLATPLQRIVEEALSLSPDDAG